jgi:hypothetical protein
MWPNRRLFLFEDGPRDAYLKKAPSRRVSGPIYRCPSRFVFWPPAGLIETFTAGAPSSLSHAIGDLAGPCAPVRVCRALKAEPLWNLVLWAHRFAYMRPVLQRVLLGLEPSPRCQRVIGQ